MATSKAATSRSTTSRPAAGPQPAYVLHRYDWSESSLVLDLYTRDEGRLPALAKGAKRPYSQLRPVLLPFQPLAVTLGRPRQDEESGESVRLLRGAEWSGGPPLIGGERLFSGFYLNELLMKLLPRQDPHPRLFDAYAEALAELAVLPPTEGAAAAAVRAFELLLLRELGLLPDLAQETLTGRALDPARAYTLRPEVGLVPASSLERAPAPEPASALVGLSGASWVRLEAALMQRHGPALRDLCAAAPPLRPLLQTLLAYHLHGAPLRTREVWRSLRQPLAVVGATSPSVAPAVS
jgi:DNA repair protein RecO (recombination protein O)